MRNSTTHPLKVNWIPIEGDKGRIGITLCPGKYQPVSWTGGWYRQLSIDVATLVELKTDRLSCSALCEFCNMYCSMFTCYSFVLINLPSL